MLSIPPASITLAEPATSMSLANIAARIPEPHILLIVTAPVESGNPALRIAWRAGAQLPRGERREVAEHAADRGAGGGDDDDGFTHGTLLRRMDETMARRRSALASRVG